MDLSNRTRAYPSFKSRPLKGKAEGAISMDVAGKHLIRLLRRHLPLKGKADGAISMDVAGKHLIRLLRRHLPLKGKA